jgi:hypothetical protein
MEVKSLHPIVDNNKISLVNMNASVGSDLKDREVGTLLAKIQKKRFFDNDVFESLFAFIASLII